MVFLTCRHHSGNTLHFSSRLVCLCSPLIKCCRFRKILCRYYRIKDDVIHLHYAFIAHCFFQRITLTLYSHQLQTQLQLLCLTVLVDAAVVSVLLRLLWLVFTASIVAVKTVKHCRPVGVLPMHLWSALTSIQRSVFTVVTSMMQSCSGLTHMIFELFLYYSFVFLPWIRGT